MASDDSLADDVTPPGRSAGPDYGSGDAARRGWRADVLREAQTIESRLYAAANADVDPLNVVKVQAAVDRARGIVRKRGGVASTFSRARKQEAANQLELARSHLARVAGEYPVVPEVAPGTGEPAELTPTATIEAAAKPTPGQRHEERPAREGSDETDTSTGARVAIPTEAGASVGSAPESPAQTEQPAAIDEEHSARKDRPARAGLGGVKLGLLIVTGLIAIGLLVVLVRGNGTAQAVVGLGATAGLLAGAPSITVYGKQYPYTSYWLFAAVKVVAGGLGAVIAVWLLQKGFGPLEPARGRAALFYALVFGFAQQAISGTLDRLAIHLGQLPRKQGTDRPIQLVSARLDDAGSRP